MHAQLFGELRLSQRQFRAEAAKLSGLHIAPCNHLLHGLSVTICTPAVNGSLPAARSRLSEGSEKQLSPPPLTGSPGRGSAPATQRPTGQSRPAIPRWRRLRSRALARRSARANLGRPGLNARPVAMSRKTVSELPGFVGPDLPSRGDPLSL